MLKNKSAALIAGSMALVGLVAGVATMASAQSTIASGTSASAAVQSQAVDISEAGDVADANEPVHQGHAPLGGDGIVSSVNGSTVVMGEESNEGGASYTIDASKATVTNNGASGSLSDIKVGAKIFVQGTTSGTNVSATSISIGHGGKHVESANDADGSGANEASEPAGTSDASDQ